MTPPLARKRSQGSGFSSIYDRQLIGSILALTSMCAIVVQCGPTTATIGSPPNVVADLNPAAAAQQQQQQQQQNSQQSAFLNQLHTQAQRQLNQLNGLVLNAANNFTASIGSNSAAGNGLPSGPIVGSSTSRLNNVLETLSSVGKFIQQQISAANNHVHIVTSPSGHNGLIGGAAGEPANSKKNEYQSIVTTDMGSSLQPPSPGGPSNLLPLIPMQANSLNSSAPMVNYREQGEQLRHEIVRRVGQLQQVVASSMDLMKNNGDLIVRRLLEQMNSRLDQAKAKADRIISEPATNEMALKALSAINLGLNNLNTIISNIVTRLDLAAKEGAQRASGGNAVNVGQPAVVSPLLDPSKLRVNLQQIGQQFQAALNNSQLHQQFLSRQRQFLALQPQPAADQQQSIQNKVNLDFNNQKRN